MSTSTSTKKEKIYSSYEKKVLAIFFIIEAILFILVKLDTISSSVYYVLLVTGFVIFGCLIIKRKIEKIKGVNRIFSNDWRIFLALQEDTLYASGFGNACVAYIKARLVILNHIESKTFISPFLRTLYNNYLRTCIDRMLFELENLKTYDNDSSEPGTYSLKSQWWDIYRFIFNNSYQDNHGKLNIREGADLMKNNISVLKIKFEDSSDFFFGHDIAERVNDKISEILYNHTLSLLIEKNGFSLASRFLSDLYNESSRYLNCISLYCMEYDAVKKLIERLHDKLIDSLVNELAAIVREDKFKRLDTYQNIQKSFIARALYGRDNVSWLYYHDYNDNRQGQKPWIQKLFTIKDMLDEKVDVLSFELGQNASTAEEKAKYINLIQNKELRDKLNKS